MFAQSDHGSEFARDLLDYKGKSSQLHHYLSTTILLQVQSWILPPIL